MLIGNHSKRRQKWTEKKKNYIPITERKRTREGKGGGSDAKVLTDQRLTTYRGPSKMPRDDKTRQTCNLEQKSSCC